METTLLTAGAGRSVINPPKGIFLIGYGDRVKGNAGVHDDLTATALVLGDGRRRVAIVACDLLCMNEFVVDQVRAACGTGVDVLVCCSHTHSGPIGYAGPESPRANREYIQFLVRQIAAAVEQAARNMRPAQTAWSVGQAGIAVNRRERKPNGTTVIGENPDGVVDRSVQTLSILGQDGARIATLVNFACHGTVWGPDNRLVSADWIGVMRSRVEQEFGGLGLFLQGATGNLNPRMGWGRKDCWAMAVAQGEGVAGEVIRSWHESAVDLPSGSIELVCQEVWLPFEAPVRSDQPPTLYRQRLLSMAGLPSWMTFLTDLLLDRRYPWKNRLEARHGFWGVPMRVNTLRVGDFELVTFGAEVFTEIGLRVKAASPTATSMVATYTDGCVGYLPTAAARAEGGYEVETAPFAYRFPGEFSDSCESLALEAVQAGWQQLRVAENKTQA